jgi:hypothetical protein
VAAGQTATFRCNAVADSSLNLTIEWLHADQLIDFEQEPRFVQSQDSSLTITKTTELDTGDYTCRAKTILDLAEDKATLIVQGKKGPPPLRDAVVYHSVTTCPTFSLDRRPQPTENGGHPVQQPRCGHRMDAFRRQSSPYLDLHDTI